jgi:O-acetyl-ADP-ribose deacetylase (regulator of RNase III)
MMGSIEFIKGDITDMDTVAIVNAANSSLMGGGGVDGAIHRAAGPGLNAECARIGSCKTGQAVITSGCNLKAKYIIHTVGPVWRGGTYNEADLLASCYKSSLKLAEDNGIKTIAFPSISTGVYGYPIEQAADIAVKSVADRLKNGSKIEKVTFVLFSDADYKTYVVAYKKLK